ncbi:MAG: small multi-drug export protein [Clostridiaceae bacterium]|nr:small multi-drug export protein [Clostridiaceae bacterium]
MNVLTGAAVEFFKRLTGNNYLTLYLVSMIPGIELRGGVILAGGMDVNPLVAMLLCVAGASTVVFPILLLLKPLISILKRHKLTKRLGERAESGIDARQKKAVLKGNNTSPVALPQTGSGSVAENYIAVPTLKEKKKKLSPELKKCIAIYLFTAIPLPLTGAWAGAAIGAFTGLPVWKSGLSVIAGNFTAGIIMSLLLAFFGRWVDYVLIAFLALTLAAILTVIWTSMFKSHSKHKNA